MRTFLIGDVHGCSDELSGLLDLIRPTRRDRLIFLGDLIDKGPDSVGVVAHLQGMRSMGFNIQSILGNHELKYLRYVQKIDTNQDPTVMKGWEDYRDLHNQLLPHEREWIKSFPFWIQVEPTLFAVHGGIGSRFRLTGAAPVFATATKEQHELTMLRYQDERGNMVHLGKETPQSQFWADAYDGRNGHVYYGHQPYKEVAHHTHATGLDTGVVFGGCLTAFCWESQALFQFPAQKRYATPMEELWGH